MNPFYALYSVFSYSLFLLSFLYAVGFVDNLVVPKTLDLPVASGGFTAFCIDTLVLAAFGAQHSLMARPSFKRWWVRFVPAAIERSTYVLFSSVFLCLIFVLWQPMPAKIWDVSGTWGAPLLLTIYMMGWLIVLLSSFMISHFELFGLTQAWRRTRDLAPSDSAFKEVLFYRFVRHPIMLGFFVAAWATPTMTLGHLVFAMLLSAYIFIGVRLEEHDLVQKLGDTYLSYRARVPMLIPMRMGARRFSNTAASEKVNR
ncbi:MAG: methanethiol S-methyltransferase [Dokdonella sp.]